MRSRAQLWSRVVAGALVALCSASVCAIDTEGYLRIGSADAGEPRRTCYDLPISAALR